MNDTDEDLMELESILIISLYYIFFSFFYVLMWLPTKVRLVKAMVFPVVMYGCESWTVKKAER